MENNLALLRLLEKLQKYWSEKGYVVVVTGGLGVAGFMGELYRDFYDLDLTVIGPLSLAEGIANLKKEIVGMGGVVVYDKPEYFQSKLENIQLDILYVQRGEESGTKVSYTTAKATVSGSPGLLKPILVGINDIKFLVFRPELAVAEKLVGSITLHQIRNKDIEDAQKVITRLDPKLLFEAMNIKFCYKENKLINTGF